MRLTGRRVTLWDSPEKGDSRVAYYPNGTTNKVGPDTEFELTNVVAYKGRYYANIRITDESRRRGQFRVCQRGLYRLRLQKLYRL